MPKIIRGTQDAKKRILLKQPAGGAGRIRCPKCSGIAIQELSAAGTQYRCTSCGAACKSSAM